MRGNAGRKRGVVLPVRKLDKYHIQSFHQKARKMRFRDFMDEFVDFLIHLFALLLLLPSYPVVCISELLTKSKGVTDSVTNNEHNI